MTPPFGPAEIQKYPDTLIDPLLLELRDCLCHELVHTRYGPPVNCYVTHSAGPPLDDGCSCTGEVVINGIPMAANGDARVRLVALDPDLVDLGGPVQHRCPPGWQAVVELSTSRCIPIPEDEQPLPAEVKTDTALKLGDDRAALIRVLACCEDVWTDRDVTTESMLPVGPLGGCAGWSMSLRIALPGGPGGGC